MSGKVAAQAEPILTPPSAFTSTLAYSGLRAAALTVQWRVLARWGTRGSLAAPQDGKEPRLMFTWREGCTRSVRQVFLAVADSP